MKGPGLLVDVVHQDVAAQRGGGRKIRFAAHDFRHFLHEANERIVTRQHESIDEDTRPAAGHDFLERLVDDERIQPERVLVDPTVVERQGGGLPIGRGS